MNKSQLIELLVQKLIANLNVLIAAAADARDAATSEEAKPENKYDTRGLEASYLAGAQSKRAEELKDAIKLLKSQNLKKFSSDEAVGLTAFVTVQVDGETEKHFFVLPVAGGNEISFEMYKILTVTPASPVGDAIMGKRVGEIASVTTKKSISEYEIIKIE